MHPALADQWSRQDGVTMNALMEALGLIKSEAPLAASTALAEPQIVAVWRCLEMAYAERRVGPQILRCIRVMASSESMLERGCTGACARPPPLPPDAGPYRLSRIPSHRRVPR